MCVDGTDDTSVMPFCTGKLGVEDEITSEELKKKYAMRRYLETADLSKLMNAERKKIYSIKVI